MAGPAVTEAGATLRTDVRLLRSTIAALFEAQGLPGDAAQLVSEALVEADLEGISSHGAMLVPMYSGRLAAGSVSPSAHAQVVVDTGSCVVLDAANMMGQISATQATDLAVERAARHGLAAVAVRNGFHFGMAARYARSMAERDCIGIVLSNTRPLMPAPGGRDRVVGNNPLAIALPTGGGQPVEVDMAMSATAMGKIRLAQQQGRTIPRDWATNDEGVPTDDPAAAIAGLLLPAAGPKGFGLAFMIDLLCGGLAGGGVGSQVQPLYGDPALPYNCAHFFLALHVPHFRPIAEFQNAVGELRDRVRASRPAPGIDRIFAPGDLAQAQRNANGAQCAVERSLLQEIAALCAIHGAKFPTELLESQESSR